MDALTIKQAIEQGYKYAGFEESETFSALDSLDDEYIEDSEWFLAEKQPFNFKMSVSEVKSGILSLMENYMEEQDQVSDDGELLEALKERTDFEALTAIINIAFEHRHYYNLSDIKLVKEP